MDNESRVSRYIEECHRRGIEVAAPSVNDSEFKFSVKDGKIVFGLGGVKNVGSNFIDSIIKSREEYGPFKSMADFCERVEGLQKRMVISLIKAGAFDFLGIERGQLLANAYEFIAHGTEMRKIRLSGQTSFFDSNAAFSDSAEVKMVECEPLSQDTLLAMEKEVLGIYLSGHPLRKYESTLKSRISFDLSHLETYEELSRVARDQSNVTLGGLLTDLRTQLTKKGEVMAFARLEDQFGALDLVIFPSVYERSRDLLVDGMPVLVNGKITYNEEMDVSLLAERFELLEDARRMEPLREANSSKPNRIPVNPVRIHNGSLIVSLLDMSQKALIGKIKKVLKTSPGSVPVILYFERENKRFKASESLNVEISDQLVRELRAVLNQDNKAEVY